MWCSLDDVHCHKEDKVAAINYETGDTSFIAAENCIGFASKLNEKGFYWVLKIDKACLLLSKYVDVIDNEGYYVDGADYEKIDDFGFVYMLSASKFVCNIFDLLSESVEIHDGDSFVCSNCTIKILEGYDLFMTKCRLMLGDEYFDSF